MSYVMHIPGIVAQAGTVNLPAPVIERVGHGSRTFIAPEVGPEFFDAEFYLPIPLYIEQTDPRPLVQPSRFWVSFETEGTIVGFTLLYVGTDRSWPSEELALTGNDQFTSPTLPGPGEYFLRGLCISVGVRFSSPGQSITFISAGAEIETFVEEVILAPGILGDMMP